MLEENPQLTRNNKLAPKTINANNENKKKIAPL